MAEVHHMQLIDHAALQLWRAGGGIEIEGRPFRLTTPFRQQLVLSNRAGWRRASVDSLSQRSPGRRESSSTLGRIGTRAAPAVAEPNTR